MVDKALPSLVKVNLGYPARTCLEVSDGTYRPDSPFPRSSMASRNRCGYVAVLIPFWTTRFARNPEGPPKRLDFCRGPVKIKPFFGGTKTIQHNPGQCNAGRDFVFWPGCDNVYGPFLG